jgi:hypothetical protein
MSMNDDSGGPGVITSLARAAGSIWLISLCFVFVAMAVAAFGFRLYYEDAIARDGEQVRLERVRAVLDYGDELTSLYEDMRDDRYYVPAVPPPPTMQQGIDELVRENRRLRDRNEANVRGRGPNTPGTTTPGGRRTPRPEPADPNPI